MKLGFIGGTFNPVHRGHIDNAAAAFRQLSLDRLIFIPASRPVHKQMPVGADPEDRFRMLELAVGGVQGFEVSRIELDRSSSSYTVYTVEQLRSLYPDADLYMIVGADSYNQLDSWKDYSRIIKLATPVVMRRRGDLSLRGDILSQAPGTVILENDFIDISSTDVRKRIRSGEPMEAYLPESVIQYIKSKGLYLR